MEEIYVIKVKGLPRSLINGQYSTAAATTTQTSAATQCSSAMPNALKLQRPNSNMDLSRKALVGFSYCYIVLSIFVIIFSLIDIIMISLINILTLITGLIYLLTGANGFWASYKRKWHFIDSKRFLKYFLLTAFISLFISGLIIIFIFIGYLHYLSATDFLRLNIVFTQIFIHLLSQLTIFTCSRILWPNRFQCCAKKWPQNQCLKQKIIIATNIFSRNLNLNDNNNYNGNNSNNLNNLNYNQCNNSDTSRSSSNNSNDSGDDRITNNAFNVNTKNSNIITSYIGGDYVFSLNKINTDYDEEIINNRSAVTSLAKCNIEQHSQGMLNQAVCNDRVLTNCVNINLISTQNEYQFYDQGNQYEVVLNEPEEVTGEDEHLTVNNIHYNDDGNNNNANDNNINGNDDYDAAVINQRNEENNYYEERNKSEGVYETINDIDNLNINDQQNKSICDKYRTL